MEIGKFGNVEMWKCKASDFQIPKFPNFQISPWRDQCRIELLRPGEGRAGGVVLSQALERAPELIMRGSEAVECLRRAAERLAAAVASPRPASAPTAVRLPLP